MKTNSTFRLADVNRDKTKSQQKIIMLYFVCNLTPVKYSTCDEFMVVLQGKTSNRVNNNNNNSNNNYNNINNRYFWRTISGDS